MSESDKVTSFKDLSPEERVMSLWSNGIDERIKHISNFNFPYINKEYRCGTFDDLIVSTEMLIKDANNYIKWLKHVKEVNSI
jgi:hypothetical protein